MALTQAEKNILNHQVQFEEVCKEYVKNRVPMFYKAREREDDYKGVQSELFHVHGNHIVYVCICNPKDDSEFRRYHMIVSREMNILYHDSNVTGSKDSVSKLYNECIARFKSELIQANMAFFSI